MDSSHFSRKSVHPLSSLSILNQLRHLDFQSPSNPFLSAEALSCNCQSAVPFSKHLRGYDFIGARRIAHPTSEEDRILYVDLPVIAWNSSKIAWNSSKSGSGRDWMEAACSDNSVCEDIGSASNLPSFNCKESNTEDQQYACSNMKDTAEIEIQEECNYCSESKEDSFIDEVVEVPANGVHLQDSHALFSEIAATSDEDDLANSMEISTSMESGLSVSFDGSVEKCLSKSVTFASSELQLSHSFCDEEIPAPRTYKRSISPPAPSNLVSAMKGGRAENGIALRSALHVKWAPDVYDPPTTSSMPPQSTKQSKNHPFKLKSKKKDKHKQKHPKGKKKKHVKGHT
ncbi:hypothetical protein M5K25_001106 [Dendrobium thyrsiflorum]|uniref:Uncharacterized protein n=1 Tax=Dendrobium thyrsiflorum TaxID=117978 RepID=A0ABD0VVP8_DENTH